MNIGDYLSAVDLANDIKEKKISPVEVMEETISTIEKRNESLNAFTFTRFDEAREKAQEAEKKLMSGDAEGSFFGIPTAAKDFLPGVPGWPGSTGGVKVLSTTIDKDYGAYTGSMVKEGAILVGKTNSPSFAFRGTCDNKMYGRYEYSVQGGLQLGRVVGRFGGGGRRWHAADRRRNRRRRLYSHTVCMVRMLRIQAFCWYCSQLAQAKRIFHQPSFLLGRKHLPHSQGCSLCAAEHGWVQPL